MIGTLRYILCTALILLSLIIFLVLRYRSTTVIASLHFLRILQNCPHSFWRWLDSPGKHCWMLSHGSRSNTALLKMAREFLCRFVPEAAIVNYYHLDSTLSGHTDHSEKDLSIPLLSIRLDNIPTITSLLHTTSFCTPKKKI